jgi:Dolichyl-phosphate-mannose-protein mannosyltransferase
MRQNWRDRLASPWAGALIIGAVACVNVIGNTRFDSPPRFDGAGYAILARALSSGAGYREIDHPDRPRHAHFPPGYPYALSAIWRVTGPSFRTAHLFSAVCTIAATIAFWGWFRRLYAPRVVFILGLALALNWTWGRIGGSIQSEPLYFLLSGLALWVSARARDNRATPNGIMIGLVLGFCMFTRHVGVCLTFAVLVDLSLRGRWREAALGGCSAFIIVLPWIVWMASIGSGTQASLIPRAGLRSLIASNGLFYIRRLPDLIVGPIVEVGTVFSRPGFGGSVTAWAVVASAIVVGGWVAMLARPRRRLGALVALCTLALLLMWPFTEAGRFLTPLAPMILAGAMEGVARLIALVRPRGARTIAASLVLAGSIPYSAYSLLSLRADAAQRTHADFDAACAVIAADSARDGPVLTRHPGDVYWLAGAQALAPPSNRAADLDVLVRRYGVAYLLVDEERYANAPTSPLAAYAESRGNQFTRVWSRGGDRPVTLYMRRKSPTTKSAKNQDFGPSKVSRP